MSNDNPGILNNPIPNFQESFDQPHELVINQHKDYERRMDLGHHNRIVLPDEVKVVDKKKPKK